ncbi:MAG TPA: response regulator [Anaeromyxobacteraceae bacterium]|nr:response regulator [Anaeromyxobacteraceae bacterium]
MAATCALVVDDERDLRENIAELLEMEGYAVRKARNGKEALEVAASEHPGIVLLDLMMPIMSGWEVVTAMRLDDELRRIPVIVISAHPAPPEGVTVISKPFQVEHLLQAVRDAVEEPRRA